MASELRIEEGSAAGGVHRIHVTGDVDLATAPLLKDAATRALSQGRGRLLLNLERVGFLDSSGLACLLGILRRVRERHGWLGVVVRRGPVMEVLTLTGVDSLLVPADTEEEALARLADG